MSHYTYDRTPQDPPPLGLVVLQTDETIEADMRRLLPGTFHVSRVPSAATLTQQSIAEMAEQITAAAALLPPPLAFSSIGYGCTSATAQIGAPRVARLIREGARTDHVTDPLSALTAACRALGVTRLALLSPYAAAISDRLRDALRAQGITTPSFGSFDEAVETNVVRIAPQSLVAAARDLATREAPQAVFLSCTNLRTLDIIEDIERHTGIPCLSSNQVLAWHMSPNALTPGQLAKATRP